MSIIDALGSACKALTVYYLAQQGGDPRTRRAAALVLALVVLLTPTACALPAQPPGAAAPVATSGRDTIVITATAGAREPGPQLPQDISAMARRIAETPDGAAVVLDASGNTTTVPLTPRRPSGLLEHRAAERRRLIDANIAVLNRLVSSLAATADGSDPLGRLDAGSRIARPGSRLVLVTSGLSTVDPWNLVETGWNLAPDRLARYLASRGALPNLAGLHVVFAGLGNVAGGQPAPGPALLRRLDGYWLAICARAGAASCALARPDALAGPRTNAHNRVPVVPIDTVPSLRPAPPPPGSGAAAQAFTTAVTEAGFDLDSARLTPDAAAGLRSIAATARRSGDRIWLTGHTDGLPGPAPGYNLALSMARAAAVRAALVALGVPTGRITETGVGATENPATATPPGADPIADARLRCVVVQLTGGPPPASVGCTGAQRSGP